MRNSSALTTPLREQLDRLAAFEPSDAPVLSLYLDMRPDQHGRDHFEPFLRKSFADRSRALQGNARKSFDADAERITEWLGQNARTSANGAAIFASSGSGGLFEAIQLDVPLDQHWLFVGSVPHLYPLAKVNDQYRRYGALLVDTNSARLFVFGLGVTEAQREVHNVKTRNTTMGGWSQARYQRHIENFHLHHMKEVVDILDRVTRDEQLDQIVVSCDDVSKPTLMEQLPKALAAKIIDIGKLDMKTPEHQVLRDTLEALREHDADADAARVEALLGAWRAGGLGVVGPDDTLKAMSMGQVEELLISASPDELRLARTRPADAAPWPVVVDTSAAGATLDPDRLTLADELVTKAHLQSARIRFIEDASLLTDVGGVGAILRFKI